MFSRSVGMLFAEKHLVVHVVAAVGSITHPGSPVSASVI